MKLASQHCRRKMDNLVPCAVIHVFIFIFFSFWGLSHNPRKSREQDPSPRSSVTVTTHEGDGGGTQADSQKHMILTGNTSVRCRGAPSDCSYPRHRKYKVQASDDLFHLCQEEIIAASTIKTQETPQVSGSQGCQNTMGPLVVGGFFSVPDTMVCNCLQKGHDRRENGNL